MVTGNLQLLQDKQIASLQTNSSFLSNSSSPKDVDSVGIFSNRTSKHSLPERTNSTSKISESQDKIQNSTSVTLAQYPKEDVTARTEASNAPSSSTQSSYSTTDSGELFKKDWLYRETVSEEDTSTYARHKVSSESTEHLIFRTATSSPHPKPVPAPDLKNGTLGLRNMSTASLATAKSQDVNNTDKLLRIIGTLSSKGVDSDFLPSGEGPDFIFHRSPPPLTTEITQLTVTEEFTELLAIAQQAWAQLPAEVMNTELGEFLKMYSAFPYINLESGPVRIWVSHLVLFSRGFLVWKFDSLK